MMRAAVDIARKSEDDMLRDYFESWYNANMKRFHSAQMFDTEIARASFDEGFRLGCQREEANRLREELNHIRNLGIRNM